MHELIDLRTQLGAAPLERDVVRVRGPEALGYLQGQLSQDVEGLAVGASAPALLLQPTGKVEAWLRVTRLADDDLQLDVDAGHGEAVAARLRRFKLRTKAEIHLETWSGFAVRGPGSAAVDVPAGMQRLPVFWPGVEGVDILGPGPREDIGVPAASGEALEALRIEAGVPAMGAELTEGTIPAEAGQWLIEASVSFTKGCYTGQELVARIDSRGGNVPRPIRGLLVHGDPVPVGADVLAADGTTVGTVTSAGRSAAFGAVALALLGRAVAPDAEVTVRWGDGERPATVAVVPLR